MNCRIDKGHRTVLVKGFDYSVKSYQKLNKIIWAFAKKYQYFLSVQFVGGAA